MALLDFIKFIDSQMIEATFLIRNDFLDHFFLFITWAGDWPLIIIFFIIFSTGLYLTKNIKYIFPLFLSVAGSGIMTLIVKYLVGRSRPDLNIALYVEKLPSFPSAHAALALAFFGFYIFYIWQTRQKPIFKILLSLVALVIIILVGLSRVYLGVHFMSDVVAGFLTGLLWLLVAMYISRR